MNPRGLQVFAINPKQLDRFRDGFSVAGARDDTRDADVLAHPLRTDRDGFRRLRTDNPLIAQLREAARRSEELIEERTRLTSRLRDQVWRYYPQALKLTDDLAATWFLALWSLAPAPAKAARLQKPTLARLLKQHRIRRLDADQLRGILHEPALVVAPGVVAAATGHIAICCPVSACSTARSRRY